MEAFRMEAFDIYCRMVFAMFAWRGSRGVFSGLVLTLLQSSNFVIERGLRLFHDNSYRNVLKAGVSNKSISGLTKGNPIVFKSE